MQIYNIETDETGRELSEHGDAWFPLAGYDEWFSEFVLGEVPWHWHNEIELVVVNQGATLVECIGHSIELNTGDGIFINVNTPHRLTQIGQIECHIINFVLKPEFIGGRYDSKIYRDFIMPICSNASFTALKLSPTIPWQHETIEHIKEAFSVYTLEEYGYELTVRSKLTEFWRLICLHERELLVDTKNLTEDELRIKTIIGFIHSNYMDKLTIKTLGQQAGISESECYRLFNRMFSCTPNDYLLNHRLQIAALNLVETNDTILSIAVALGFGGASYFSKRFKERYGQSPRVFRNIHTK